MPSAVRCSRNLSLPFPLRHPKYCQLPENLLFIRKHSIFIAASLLSVLSVQMLDMGFCCSWSVATNQSEAACIDADASDLQPTLSACSDFEQPDEATQADCFCHLVYTSAYASSDMQGLSDAVDLIADLRTTASSASLSPPDHVPLV